MLSMITTSGASRRLTTVDDGRSAVNHEIEHRRAVQKLVTAKVQIADGLLQRHLCSFQVSLLSLPSYVTAHVPGMAL